jgi:hypothetical protein
VCNYGERRHNDEDREYIIVSQIHNYECRVFRGTGQAGTKLSGFGVIGIREFPEGLVSLTHHKLLSIIKLPDPVNDSILQIVYVLGRTNQDPVDSSSNQIYAFPVGSCVQARQHRTNKAMFLLPIHAVNIQWIYV